MDKDQSELNVITKLWINIGTWNVMTMLTLGG